MSRICTFCVHLNYLENSFQSQLEHCIFFFHNPVCNQQAGYFDGMKNHSVSKISETILNFGQPLISQLGDDYGKEELEHCMRIVISAWNAVTLDDVQSTDTWTTSLLQHAEGGPDEVVSILKSLLHRKKTMFREDLRGVGEHWIKLKRGEIVFGCEARDVESRYANVPHKSHVFGGS